MTNLHGNYQNGMENGLDSPAHSSGPADRFARPFALREALPYSPFTSIIPFESNIIPTPTLSSGSPPTPLSELVPRQDFDTLNAEAAQHPASRLVEQGLEQVQQLFKSKKATQFTFKSVPEAIPGATPSSPGLTAGLSPFTRMVFDKTNALFRYPSPDSPDPLHDGLTPTMAHKKSPLPRKADTPKLSSSSIAANKMAHAQNAAALEIVIPSKAQFESAKAALFQPANTPPAAAAAATPAATALKADTRQPSPLRPDIATTPGIPVTPVKPILEKSASPSRPVPGSATKATLTIELPANPSFNREEFQVVPDILVDVPQNLSERRHDADGFGDDQDIYGGLDQRQRADAAFQEIRRLCQDIFAAEQDVVGQSRASPLVTLTVDQEPTLTDSAQKKIHTLVQKAISLGCFAYIPIDDLVHLQRLSDGALKHARNLDVKLSNSSGEGEIEAWLQQLPDVDLGLKAARTSLKIMCGGREEKQIYSEDIIQSAVDLFRNVVDGIVVPVAELRNSGDTQDLFKLLSAAANKKAISAVFTSCQRLYALMASLVSAIDLSETVVNTLEFTASLLMFVENAHTERDAVLGVQAFDGLRLVAMDMLSQIFLTNPELRSEIFNEILTSLEKLPVGKQSARQFKLVDGKSIQPVSALIMRLVQASAGRVSDKKSKARIRALPSLEDDGGGAGGSREPNGFGSANGPSASAESAATITSEEQAAAQHGMAIQELENAADHLCTTAYSNASYVVNFIVSRAMKATKSGDAPYRNLLDLFVEDFTSCLDSPDWPAAEVLVRLFMITMVNIIDGERQPAPAKNMALEILGVMGAAISKLRSNVRMSANLLGTVDADELSRFLAELATAVLDQKSRPEVRAAWSGPYRATLEYLEGRCSEDPHLSSAISYGITEWANKVYTTYDFYQDEDEVRDQELGRLAYRLRMMIEDRRWLSSQHKFAAVSPSQAKLSHSIILISSKFCESFNKILNILLVSMSSDQATVRSKSLRSVNQVLETDPSILDGESEVVSMIVQCASDSSTQVRDSALGLVGKAISMRPALEELMLPTILARFSDAGVGVRKRAMKLARDIYLRNDSREVRSKIANGLLHRVQDPDEGVRDLARQMIEEVWIFPFYQGEGTAAYKTSLADHVALIVQTVKNGSVTPILDKVFQAILSPEAKAAKTNFEVCRRLAASMFDLVGSTDSKDPAAPSSGEALQVLMIFAKADPRLFTFEQIRLLKPYTASLQHVKTSYDTAVARAVVVIYRRVLPQLSSVHDQFLNEVRQDLLKSLSKISARNLIDDVIACVWIIAGLLNDKKQLVSLIISTLLGVQKCGAVFRAQKTPDETAMRRFSAYALLAALVGKHCDLDDHIDKIRAAFPKWEGNALSELIVKMFVPFAQPSQHMEVRKSALDTIGLVCQAWPRNLVSAGVYTTFQQVFDEQNPALEGIVLRSLKEFLTTEEQRSETAAEAAKMAKAAGKEATGERKLTVMGGTNHDDVASATTQRFLGEITRIALATTDDHAFLAAEVLGSINRQGLVHPKETGVTMLTLETSPVGKMSELAFAEHRAMHGKYESVLEREYVKAIQSAFQYQRDVIKDPRGATTDPFAAKLHLLMEVLKDSKSKNRQRLLEKMVSQVDFQPAKLDVSEEMPSHLESSRFTIENLAFFDYITIGELHYAVTLMEKVVQSTGPTLAHAIESEIFRVRMDIEPSFQVVPEGDGDAAAAADPSQVNNQPLPVDAQRLRQLAAGSMVLLLLWEARTYLCRAFGVRREGNKGKAVAKDLAKAPTKVQGITGDKFWEDSGSIMAGLTSQEQMIERCKAMVELMTVDKEFKLPDEEEAIMDGAEDLGTPSEGEDDDLLSGERGRKRRANGNTPGGRKRRQRSSSQQPRRKRGRPRKNPFPEEQQPDADLEDGDFESVDWL